MRVKPSSRCHDAVRIPGRLAGGLRAIGFTCDRQSRVGTPHSGRARHCGLAPRGAHDPPGPAARQPGTRVSWPLAARGAFAGSVSESPCSSGTEGPRRRGEVGPTRRLLGDAAVWSPGTGGLGRAENLPRARRSDPLRRHARARRACLRLRG